MTDSQATATTVDGSDTPQSSRLDLTSLPYIHVLATHLSAEEHHEAEALLSSHGALLTNNIHKAKIVLANISRSQRARLELKWSGLKLQDAQRIDVNKQSLVSESRETSPAKKKRRLANNGDPRDGKSIAAAQDDSSTASDGTDEIDTNSNPMSQLSISDMPTSPSASKTSVVKTVVPGPLPDLLPDSLIVIRLDWLNAAVSANDLISMEPFIILNVRLLPAQELESPHNKDILSAEMSSTKEIDVGPAGSGLRSHGSSAILERAKADHKPKPVYSRFNRRDRIAEAARPDIVGKSFSTSQAPQLLRQTTSENNEEMESILPPMPDWVVQKKLYSCERYTPLNPPNADFIELLKRIRLARELTLDQIGVRAYSTSIASLSAYPYRLQSSREVLALPGCDAKIAHLFNEYHTTGQLQAVRDIDASPVLTSLQEFYEIWGVGATTAREFYYEKGWRDLDDIIEHGWKSLTRGQQIGLKYYDDFQIKLSRADVEAIAETITHHATLATDSNIQTAIVGGYRRGQPFSSDVDIILSHPDEHQTYNLVSKVVASLTAAKHITHTLSLHQTHSNRNQEPVPIRPTKQGHGFDTLDKALVVWLHHPSTSPSPTKPPLQHHCRVDIITSPPQTLGCAILGWSSGTTFQRDLRRYARKTRGWKFDSSGIRDLATGVYVDVEGWRDERTRCRTWEEAERRVFEGLGLVFREAGGRCTG